MKPPMHADLQTWFEVQTLHAAVARVLDSGDLASWPDFFTEDCIYRVQSRENHDRGLPLATMRLESRAMLRDRVYGASETIFHHPYAQRHLIGPPVILRHDRHPDGDEVECEASFLVVRTHQDALPEVLAVGRTIDVLVRADGGWKFRQRLCIFDNDLLPNSLVHPI